MWMCYHNHYETGGNQLDREPTKYSRLKFFDDELAAYRWANSRGGTVIEVKAGVEM